nr:ATP synthase F0 subunit 8 [Eysarcoris gibbosus]
MPQMAPLWWEILFLMFMLSYLMSTTLLYFNFKVKMNKNNCVMKLFNMNWKW